MLETYHYNANRASDTTNGAIHSLIAMSRRTPSAQIVAANVRQLMDHHGLSQAELGRRAGVAQTLLSGLLSRDAAAKNPTCATIDKLATYFKLAPWQLLVPGMSLDLLQNDELSSVLESYAKAPVLGRQTILRVAEAEARYAAMDRERGLKTG